MSRPAAVPRFFAAPLTPGTTTLDGPEAHHAAHVLRLKPGAPVELFDGAGRWAQGVLARAARGAAEVQVEAVAGPEPRPGRAVSLAFAPPKGKRLDWLIEKAAELGAAELAPLTTARSVAGADGAKAQDRWRAICVSAIRQSRQRHLPRLHRPAPLEEVLQPQPDVVTILADCRADAVGLAELPAPAPGQTVRLLIGPEGGWTDAEARAAADAGAPAARLGGSVLRIETAAVALLAAVRALWDE